LLPAIGATLRLILKAFFLVEFLFTFGEYELFVTVTADNSFVWHCVSPVFFRDRTFFGLSRENKESALWEC
jgi:hypothetical protein